MSTHRICSYEEIKNIPELASNTEHKFSALLTSQQKELQVYLPCLSAQFCLKIRAQLFKTLLA